MEDTLFSLDTSQGIRHEILDRLKASLPAERKEKVDSFRNPADAERSLLSWYIIRHALRESGLKRDEEISFSETGKPYLPGRPDTHFNVSHSGHMIICAVSSGRVGADIEKIRPVDRQTMLSVLSGEEQSVFLTESDPLDWFFTAWTVKESLLKFRGAGMAVHPSTVTVRVSGHRVTVDSGEKLTFDRPFIAAGYKAAVCRDAGAPDLVQVKLRVQDLARVKMILV